MRWKNRRLLRMVRLAVQAAVAASPLLLHAAGVVVVDEVDGLRSNCWATPKCGVAFPVNSSFIPLAPSRMLTSYKMKTYTPMCAKIVSGMACQILDCAVPPGTVTDWAEAIQFQVSRFLPAHALNAAHWHGMSRQTL